MHNSAHLQKSFRDVSEIEKDVDTLEMNVHGLLKKMGLDPEVLAKQEQQAAIAQGFSQPPAAGIASGNVSQQHQYPLHAPQPVGQDVSMTSEPDQEPSFNVNDFDFEAFWKQLSTQQNGDGSFGLGDLGGGMDGMHLGYPNDDVSNAANIAELDDITGSHHAQMQNQYGHNPRISIDTATPTGYVNSANGYGQNVGMNGKQETDPQNDELHAFLDEVASASSGASPVLRAQDSPGAARAATNLGKKRKSEVAELASELPLSVEDSVTNKGGTTTRGKKARK